MNGPIPIDYYDLTIAASLVVAAGVVSLVFQLGTAGRLAVAAIRTVIQLSLIGYVLDRIFDLDQSMPVLGLMAIMITVAGREAVRRSARVYRGIYMRATFTLLLTGVVTTFTVTELVIGVESWFEPQYVIPILGMILGNGLTGISLCLDYLLETADERRALIEMELCHGATRWEAMREPFASAVRRGMIPIINSMTVAGLVSLPGMVSGQILAGSDPFVARKYQILIMFTISGATAFGCMLVSLFVYRNVTNARHQLLADKISRRRTAG